MERTGSARTSRGKGGGEKATATATATAFTTETQRARRIRGWGGRIQTERGKDERRMLYRRDAEGAEKGWMRVVGQFEF